ncbi:hypothetical protein [Clostridium aminobutyricum]|uniref:DUF4825 domain-containing protein n=1 Tax=Clostridium aminobutyricum TaxID=33953 RepID=A0A939D9V4_CLOAM|nr:hypothetical protein [Clostridium aminobutyricum]MBN7773423.1 hypothetical protein [Clostridium aminobutyricum]
MKKQFMVKHRKHFITMTCLVAGMLVLTTAVYANYDNAGGYTNYKNAVKNLAFDADNYTADANMTFIMDGEEMTTSEFLYKCNNGDTSQYNLTNDNFSGEASKSEYYSYVNGDKRYVYYPETNMYYESKIDGEKNKTIIPLDDATSKKAVRFAELMADAFVGDLKNNVVLVSEEDGVRKYSIHVEKSQIPEIVNAGLSLMFTANNNSPNSSSYVTYKNYEKTFNAFYKEKTGNDYKSLDYSNLSESEQEALNDIYNAFDKKYSGILEAKGHKGIVLVLANGDYKYYTNYSDYMNSEYAPNEAKTMAMFGDDPYVDDVTMNVTLDEKGRLAENYLEASLMGKDKNGEKHVATMKVNSKIYDYDKTSVDLFNPEGKTKQN